MAVNCIKPDEVKKEEGILDNILQVPWLYIDSEICEVVKYTQSMYMYMQSIQDFKNIAVKIV